jgi:hypothetical protein
VLERFEMPARQSWVKPAVISAVAPGLQAHQTSGFGIVAQSIGCGHPVECSELRKLDASISTAMRAAFGNT